MDFTFVFTFPERYAYAFDHVRAAADCLPKNGNIIVQFEGKNLPESGPRIKWQHMPMQKIEKFKELSKLKNNRVRVKQKGPGVIENDQYVDRNMWNWDAFRFCHKIYAQYHTLAHSNRYMIYLDSDVIFHTKVPEDFFYELFDEGKYVSYINRDSGMHQVPDTGYVGFDTSNPLQTKFWDEMLRLYDEGAIFERTDGWTDCQALAHCIEHIDNSAKKLIETKNIGWDSWKHTPLSKYCMHHKADYFHKPSS